MVPVNLPGDWVCSSCIPTHSAGIQLELNIKALIVLRNCPKATGANFLSFYPQRTTSCISFGPESEKSTSLPLQQLQVESKASPLCVGVWRTREEREDLGHCRAHVPPNQQAARPVPSEWQAVRSCLTLPHQRSLCGWRGQRRGTPGRHTSQIRWLFPWTRWHLHPLSLLTFFFCFLCFFQRLFTPFWMLNTVKTTL